LALSLKLSSRAPSVTKGAAGRKLIKGGDGGAARAVHRKKAPRANARRTMDTDWFRYERRCVVGVCRLMRQHLPFAAVVDLAA
jgi:hypothetical protein